MTYMNSLEIKNLSFRFDKKGPLFFNNLNISFPARKLHFIRGKNGSGKSTFLRIINGNLNKGEAVSGIFRFDEKDFTVQNTAVMPNEMIDKVKLVPQNFDTTIADQFNFLDNLRLANFPHYPGLSELPYHKPIPHLIERFGIDFNKPAYLLSGGQRQILAILMALQKPTTVLLFDEPTAALDIKNAEMVMDFLSGYLGMTPYLTIIIVCHDTDIVERYAPGYYHMIEVNEESNERVLHRVEL